MKTYLRGIVVFGSLAAMVIVPATMLDEPRPARFGWQMYSSLYTPPTVEIVHSDQRVTEVQLEDLVAAIRPWPDYTGAATRHLCAANPDATTIRFVRDEPAMSEEFSCEAS